jgi:signal transduction histidine kinase
MSWTMSARPVASQAASATTKRDKGADMSLASDQDAGAGKPSALSQRMCELRECVLAEWAARVRAEVEGAERLPEPILFNTFPVLYDNIVQAVTPAYPRTSAEVATPSVAPEHGGERARLTSYGAKSVIREYQILRSTIIDVLKRHTVQISDEEAQIITSSIDASIREAITTFALTQAAFREQFVAALAHDLRNPLANASVAAQLICRTTDLGKIRNYAGKISENLGRVDQMIRELLDSVLFQSGERLPLRLSNFDIHDVVTEVCEQFEIAHGQRFELHGTSVRGWWGRDEMQRALENLISNALKYGVHDKPIGISYASEHGRLQLSVHNHGDSIPPDQLEAVFQVFRRAKAAKEGDTQGWGIGLPFVRSVVERHGGSIDVDSSEERGTTFSINIPLDARPYQNAPTLEKR